MGKKNKETAFEVKGILNIIPINASSTQGMGGTIM